MNRLFIFTFLLIVISTTHSQTIIPGGFVSGTWAISQSPFQIQGNIEIPFDSTLIIEPGVEVLFDSSYKLTVQGLLDASGTEADSILFTATNPITGWQGIEFYQINEDLGTSNLQYCTLTHGKKPGGNGGAINVYQSENVLINHCLIRDNFANSGGGIYIDDGWIQIMNTIITQNHANQAAGGIACGNSRPYFFNLEVTYNSSGDAGGISFGGNPTYSYPFFEDLVIMHNTGGSVGGLLLEWSTTLVLDNCRICYNTGNWCGGIALIYSDLGYWGYPALKNQVYMNRGGVCHDLYYEDEEGAEGTIINLDTFTIQIPDRYHVYPPDKFNFIDGIQHWVINQADTDVYISPSGSDSNDGLTPQTPLRSFDYSLRKIRSNTEDNNTLWVLPGHYFLNESDSSRPIILKDHVKIAATVPGTVVIDADSVCRVFYGYLKNDFTLSGLTIQNGYDGHEGGGIYFYSSSGLLDSCRIASNYAGGTYGSGGGVYLEGNFYLRFRTCDFIENTAESLGGGLRYYNFNEQENAFIELNNCSFIANHSNGAAGGLCCMDNQISIKNCRFTANTSVGSGAGCYFSNQMPVLTNCLFDHNISEKTGGGFYTLGGINESSKIINCTFTDNQAISGSAVYQYLLRYIFCINSVFYNHEVSTTDLIHVNNLYNTGFTSFYTNYSDIQGGEASIVLEGAGAELYWQEGNITADPAFIDPANNDYSLNWNSPCIEAGKPDTTGLHLPETDLNGDPRIVNPRIDMGACEFQFPVGLTANKPCDSSFKIYPAVTKSMVTIEFSEDITNQSRVIKIYSVDGIEMKEEQFKEGVNNVLVDVSNFPSGLYLVSFNNSVYRNSIGRFIVTR